MMRKSSSLKSCVGYLSLALYDSKTHSLQLCSLGFILSDFI